MSRTLPFLVLAWLIGSTAGGMAANPRGDAAFNAGLKAIQGQDWKVAVEQLEVAIVFEPSNADAYERLGYAHQQLGNSDKALKYFSTALEIDPNHVGALSRHGMAMLSNGNLEQANQDLKRLSRRCGAGCGPHDELQRALDSAKKQGGS